jgi:tRNA threonylcarbamoyl adenosine modification protein (Sua5/YciO/YrdC/YwlC family)
MAQLFRIHPQNPERRLIRQAAAIVRDGGIVAYPTDSSYALGCAIGATDAVRRMRAIRAIDERHPLTLMCRDLAEIGKFARLDNRQFRVVRRGAPGPFTFLLTATREVPRRLFSPKRSTIGVRVPAHPVAQALLAELDEPLLSATLIIPGDHVPLNDADDIRARLEKRIELVIDAGACPLEPTTVVDLESDPAEVIRRGRGDLSLLGLGEAVS